MKLNALLSIVILMSAALAEANVLLQPGQSAYVANDYVTCAYGNPPPPPPPSIVEKNIYCASEDFKTKNCFVGRMMGQPVVTSQESSARCNYGQGWTYNSDSISVHNGCRAWFRVRVRQ